MLKCHLKKASKFLPIRSKMLYMYIQLQLLLLLTFELRKHEVILM